MYQNIFVIDDVPFKERKHKDQKTPENTLKNFNYYLPKLEKDFYLNSFIKHLLFDIDVLDVEDFITFQYENSKEGEKFLKTLKLKVAPAIDTIITKAAVSFEGNGEYYNQVKLEDDFVESEGIIKNRYYGFPMFYHWAAINQLEEDLKVRRGILIDYLEKTEKPKNNLNSLTWSGKPAHLAIIIASLIDEGYISPPIKNNNEINWTELSRQIINSFKIKEGTTINTLRIYSSSDSEKHIDLKGRFTNNGFHIPHSGIMS